MHRFFLLKILYWFGMLFSDAACSLNFRRLRSKFFSDGHNKKSAFWFTTCSPLSPLERGSRRLFDVLQTASSLTATRRSPDGRHLSNVSSVTPACPAHHSRCDFSRLTHTPTSVLQVKNARLPIMDALSYAPDGRLPS